MDKGVPMLSDDSRLTTTKEIDVRPDVAHCLHKHSSQIRGHSPGQTPFFLASICCELDDDSLLVCSKSICSSNHHRLLRVCFQLVSLSGLRCAFGVFQRKSLFGKANSKPSCAKNSQLSIKNAWKLLSKLQSLQIVEPPRGSSARSYNIRFIPHDCRTAYPTQATRYTYGINSPCLHGTWQHGSMGRWDEHQVINNRPGGFGPRQRSGRTD